MYTKGISYQTEIQNNSQGLYWIQGRHNGLWWDGYRSGDMTFVECSNSFAFEISLSDYESENWIYSKLRFQNCLFLDTGPEDIFISSYSAFGNGLSDSDSENKIYLNFRFQNCLFLDTNKISCWNFKEYIPKNIKDN